jgi:hypothetical protein
MSRLSPRIAVAVCVLILAIATSSKGQQESRVTGFFSDMRHVSQARDVQGTEIWIVYGGGHYWATVQVAQGAPAVPAVVPVEVSGAQVRFSLTQRSLKPDGTAAEDVVLRFNGTVTKSGLTGVLGSEHVVLKRRQSYWQ